ncbi:MAG TPA: hypothetical protein PK156_34920 [Polyangium sp.]|nr:hypothetical protein [Polyangium sp.]
MTQPATTWLELNFDRVGGDIRISARGSRNEQPARQSLSIEPDQLLRFALDMERAARYGQPLAGPVLEAARALQQAVLRGPMATLFAKLGEAAHGGLLVRIMVRDPDLQGVPWESLCNPGEALGFWGTSPKVLQVRGVASNEAWLQPRAGANHFGN